MAHQPCIALDIDDTLLGVDVWDPDIQDNGQSLIAGSIESIRAMQAAGLRVVLYTSRKDKLREHTVRQLDTFGVPYDELYFGKLQFDLLVDNKAERFCGEWNSDVAAAMIARTFENTEIDKKRYPTLYNQERS